MADAVFIIIIGGLFILLGVGFLLWGGREARQYEEVLAARFDLRELMEHTPERPEPGALKIGGIIALVLGAGLVIGGLFLLK